MLLFYNLPFIYTFRYDIFTDLFTPDPKAIIAFFIGLMGGLLGTFIRFSLRYNKPKDGLNFYRPGDILHYIGWPAFGSLAAVTINTFPFISLIIGVFAPLLYRGIEKAMQQDPTMLLPFFNKQKKD
jgi:hypothetical protein